MAVKLQSRDKSEKCDVAACHEGRAGLLLRLLERLQTTLDMSTQLSLILSETGPALGLDGIQLEHETLSISAGAGKTATHSCGYRLITSEENLGELIFQRNTKFTDDELLLLESLLTTIMPSLRNALRFRMARDAALHDPQTGARNERNLNQLLPREINLAKRHNRQLSAVMITVDGTNSVNARVQHLRALVSRIRTICRETDIIFRLETDELLVLMHDTGATEAAHLARHISTAVDGTQAGGKSAGMHDSSAHHVRAVHATLSGTDTAQSFINRAWDHLRHARAAGLTLTGIEPIIR